MAAFLFYFVFALAANSFAQEGGRGWVIQDSSIGVTLTGLAFADANTGYAIGATGTIYRTTNSGATWIGQVSHTVKSFTGISCTDANTATAVGQLVTFDRTTDGGTTWVRQSISALSVTHTLEAVSFINANTGMVVSNHGEIMETKDGCASWTALTSGTTSALYGVCLLDANNGFAVGDGNIIFHTSDGGSTWTGQLTNNYHGFRAISCTDVNNATVIGLYGEIYRTVNGGATWVEQPCGTIADLFAVSFTNANTGTVVGDSGIILRTTNGGATWMHQISGTTSQVYGVCFVDAAHGWAVAQNGYIYHTDDGGGIADVKNISGSDAPFGFTLSQNYPNPFSNSAEITFSVSNGELYGKEIELSIYDLQGNKITTLYRGNADGATHSAHLDASTLPSGEYYYVLSCDGWQQRKQMSVVR